MMIRAGVLGGTGYVGQELIRLLHSHTGVTLAKIISKNYAKQDFSHVYRNFLGHIAMPCEDMDFHSLADGIDILFTSLPYGVLMEHLTEEIMDQVKIIDLGVDYRFMDEREFLAYYGKNHPSMHLSDRFAYGLSEWNENCIRGASHIANPGCYATAMELALIPLLKEDMIGESVLVDGKCSVSGAGRTLSLGTHFAEANESVKAYRITNHPHARECVCAVKHFTGREIDLTFVPHIVPMQRGMLITCYANLREGADVGDVRHVYGKYYGDKPFVEILDPGMYVESKWVRNSNMCHINFEVYPSNRRLIVVCAIDNLIKGAAGQAVQNLNIMFGLPQRTGLEGAPTCL